MIGCGSEVSIPKRQVINTVDLELFAFRMHRDDPTNKIYLISSLTVP